MASSTIASEANYTTPLSPLQLFQNPDQPDTSNCCSSSKDQVLLPSISCVPGATRVTSILSYLDCVEFPFGRQPVMILHLQPGITSVWLGLWFVSPGQMRPVRPVAALGSRTMLPVLWQSCSDILNPHPHRLATASLMRPEYQVGHLHARYRRQMVSTELPHHLPEFQPYLEHTTRVYVYLFLLIRLLEYTIIWIAGISERNKRQETRRAKQPLAYRDPASPVVPIELVISYSIL